MASKIQNLSKTTERNRGSEVAILQLKIIRGYLNICIALVWRELGFANLTSSPQSSLASRFPYSYLGDAVLSDLAPFAKCVDRLR